jgi:hypothetical protein
MNRFRLDIARANERAASANETAERERFARLQLEARLADRVLTPDQQGRITAAFKGQIVEVVVFGESTEISNFSGAIVGSVAKAEDIGLTIKQSSGIGMAVRGVLVGVKPSADASVQRVADLFIRILQETVGVGPWDFDKLIGPSGLVRTQQVGKPIKPGETAPLKIFIGSKQ